LILLWLWQSKHDWQDNEIDRKLDLEKKINIRFW